MVPHHKIENKLKHFHTNKWLTTTEEVAASKKFTIMRSWVINLLIDYLVGWGYHLVLMRVCTGATKERSQSCKSTSLWQGTLPKIWCARLHFNCGQNPADGRDRGQKLRPLNLLYMLVANINLIVTWPCTHAAAIYTPLIESVFPFGCRQVSQEHDHAAQCCATLNVYSKTKELRVGLEFRGCALKQTNKEMKKYPWMITQI